jgi:uncharacterized protein YdeI (YjbR/CyaY-like superfamily)
MAERKSLRPRNRAAWRKWLERNHAASRGVWLHFHKKHTGKASITYPEALDEALCFGWIDSIVRRIDADIYARKFTPRTNEKNWSARNLGHMQRLIDAGRMTEAGIRVLGVDRAAPECRPPEPASIASAGGSSFRPVKKRVGGKVLADALSRLQAPLPWLDS